MTNTIYDDNKPTFMPEVEVSVQDPEWETMGDVHDLVQMIAQVTLSSALLPREAMNRKLEASVVLANDDLVRVLNREYRQKDTSTNVLTFASLDGDDMTPEGEPLNLGDVILSFQTIEREAQEQGKFMLDHLKHMTVHGVLHLLGYDHENEEEANDMETLEIRILENLGVQNPYIETEFNL